MTDDNDQPVAWNEEARISCDFSFQCPKMWEGLSSTDNPSIRHCSECDRDVHLALTEEDFRRNVDEGHCVAVRVLRTVLSPEDSQEGAYAVGRVHIPYTPHLKRG